MDNITAAELDEILADVKQMWEALGDVAMQVPAAREIVEPRRHLPQVIDMVFDQAKQAGVAQSESERTWIACSERLPRAGSEPDVVLGWFPQMKSPDVFPVNTVRRWHLDPDPIPGAMWMPLPEAPK